MLPQRHASMRRHNVHPGWRLRRARVDIDQQVGVLPLPRCVPVHVGMDLPGSVGAAHVELDARVLKARRILVNLVRHLLPRDPALAVAAPCADFV
eukprot:352473-Chlamydomonas_euryale.AAC.5